MFRKSFMTIAAIAAIGAAVALAPRLLPRRVAAEADMAVADTVPWPRMVAVWARTPWVAGSALADSAAADSPSAGTVGRVRSPSTAASFATRASTAVFAALPSTAAPSTATITATIVAGSGIPAATATCESGSVDRRLSADEKRRSLRGVRRRHVCFVGNAEDGLLRRKSREREFPDRLEIGFAVTREFVGGEDHAAQFAGELFEARGQVYRGADAGEIEPVSAADVAIQDVADVKRQSKTHAADFNSGRPIQRSDVSARLICAGQCARANLRGVALVSNREDGQQAVAHEFENVPAMLDDRGNLAIEIVIEQLNQSLRGHTVRQQGEAAHIGQPDCRMDRFGVTPPNLAGENSFAGVVADIGIEQIARGSPQRADFGDPRERSDDRFDGFDLRVAKATRLPRGPSRQMNLAVGE